MTLLTKLLYNFSLYIFAFFYLPSFFLKQKHKQAWQERFGRIPVESQRKLAGKEVVWIHAVSVGEITQSIRFAQALKKTWPSRVFVLTTTTVAGRETAMKLKSDDDIVLYFPVDFRGAVRRFVTAVKPSIVILFETEIWPNLIFELSKRKIPVWIVNGRISDKAISSYRRVRFLLKPVLSRLTGVLAQDQAMAKRFVEIGAPEQRVSVSGNVKFDWSPSGAFAQAARDFKMSLPPQSLLWLAGSTHEGEEEILFDAYGALKAKYSNLILLVALRHLTRLDKVKKKAAETGFSGIHFLEQMGALGDYYAQADLVFVGGSLVPVGGHNLVEPAYFGKAITVGPYLQNFREMAAIFKQAGAVVQAESAEDLKAQTEKLLANAAEREALGHAAKKIIEQHQGAVSRTVQVLTKRLGEAHEKIVG